jgi:hypothetical protein
MKGQLACRASSVQVTRARNSPALSRHQAAPGMQAARLVVSAGTRTTAHRGGRVKQGGCFSSESRRSSSGSVIPQ